MYKIIGADGKEYGPVSADQIRQWITEGRVIAQTKAQAEGSTEWRPLSDFAEFADALGAGPAGSVQATLQTPDITRDHVLRKVKPPAICLLIAAVLYACWTLFDLVSRLVMVRSNVWLDRLAQGQPEMKQLIRLMMGPVGIGFDVLYLVLEGIVILGAIRMMKLQSYGLAIASSIIMLLPCIMPCCVLGLPIGIWTLIVLLQPDVKTQFH